MRGLRKILIQIRKIPIRTTGTSQVTLMVVLLILFGIFYFSFQDKPVRFLYQKASILDDSDQAFCKQDDLSPDAPLSCTIITASQGDTALYANNEDWISPQTYYWTRQGSEDTYGAIYFGFDNFFPQGGMNEMGLAYDVNGLPSMKLNPHPELPFNIDKFGYFLLERSATVEDAIAWLSSFSWGTLGGQIHVADASGDAVVMSAGPDGELAFTRKEPGDGFLVSTNFNLAYPQNGTHPCWRYNKATKMLEKIFESSELDVEQLREVLDAVHQESAFTNTVYSNIFDLKKRVIYLYHWYQFDEVVVLDLEELLTREDTSYKIRDQFSQETQDQAEAALEQYLGIPGKWRNVAIIYLAITSVTLLILLWKIMRVSPMSWRMRLTWFLGGVILGPFGLFVYLLSKRRVRRGETTQGSTAPWRVALTSSMYSMAGYGVVWFLTLAYMIYFVGEFTPRDFLGLTYVLPLLIGVLLIRTTLIAGQRKNGFWDALRRSIIPEFIALNIACIGFIPAAFLPVQIFFTDMPRIGDPLLWFNLMLGVLAGFVTLFLLNLWIAHKGFSSGNEFLSSGAEPEVAAGDVLTLRNAWYLAIASFALYLGTVYVTFIKM